MEATMKWFENIVLRKGYHGGAILILFVITIIAYYVSELSRMITTKMIWANAQIISASAWLKKMLDDLAKEYQKGM